MSKVAIIGAGSVGASIAYAAILRGLVEELVLVDVQADKARAQALDLAHGAMFVPPVQIRAGSLPDCAEARVVIITAGAKQKPGQSRLDLGRVNGAMIRDLAPQIVEHAPDAIVLVVSNPVDVLTTLFQRATGLSPARVLGSGTVLDTSRLRYVLGRRFTISPDNVHAFVVGEHGDSEVVLWSSAQIGGVPLDAVVREGRRPLDAGEKDRIADGVRHAAGEIIRVKGATNWAIGLAVARILRAILRNENAVLTVSRQVDDYHGVSGVALSVPWVVGREGAHDPLVVPFDPREQAAFRRSAETIAAELEAIARQQGPA